MGRVNVLKIPGWTQTLELSVTSASTVYSGRRIELDYPCENITGVFDNSAGTGTNYWTVFAVGTPAQKTRESKYNEQYIVLPENSGLAASTACYVTYRVPQSYKPQTGAFGITGSVGLPEMFSISGDNTFAVEMTDKNTGFPEKIVLNPQVGGMVVKSTKVITDGADIDMYIYDDPGSVAADTYATSNQDADQNIGDDTNNAVGQSFTGNGGVLLNAALWLKAIVSPTGNAVCKIYASTGSDPNRTPTGSALATSAVVDVSAIGATYETVNFVFTDEFPLVAATTYFIVIEYDGDATNYLHWGTDTSTPAHASNNFAVYTSSWAAAATTDGCFTITSTGNPTDANILWLSETINGMLISNDVWVIDAPTTEIWVGYVDNGTATPASTSITLRGAPVA